MNGGRADPGGDAHCQRKLLQICFLAPSLLLSIHPSVHPSIFYRSSCPSIHSTHYPSPSFSPSSPPVHSLRSYPSTCPSVHPSFHPLVYLESARPPPSNQALCNVSALPWRDTRFGMRMASGRRLVQHGSGVARRQGAGLGPWEPKEHGRDLRPWRAGEGVDTGGEPGGRGVALHD